MIAIGANLLELLLIRVIVTLAHTWAGAPGQLVCRRSWGAELSTPIGHQASLIMSHRHVDKRPTAPRPKDPSVPMESRRLPS